MSSLMDCGDVFPSKWKANEMKLGLRQSNRETND